MSQYEKWTFLILPPHSLRPSVHIKLVLADAGKDYQITMCAVPVPGIDHFWNILGHGHGWNIGPDRKVTVCALFCIPMQKRPGYNMCAFHFGLAGFTISKGPHFTETWPSCMKVSFLICVVLSSNFICLGQVTPTLTNLLTFWFPVFWALQSCRKIFLGKVPKKTVLFGTLSQTMGRWGSKLPNFLVKIKTTLF